MMKTLESPLVGKQSTLQKVLTAAVDDLGLDSTIAIVTQDHGPFEPQVWKGFSSREVRAIFRALTPDVWGTDIPEKSTGIEPSGSLRLRMITPGAKVILAVPLMESRHVIGALVVGKKEHANFSKRDKASIETARTTIVEELKKAKLFDATLILGKPLVAQEPQAVTASASSVAESPTYTNPEIQKKIEQVLEEAQELVGYDRAWVTMFDPLASTLEVLGGVGGHKKELLPGHRLLLEESASGWAVRHRKLRIDQNLASTQGRFHDYKQLYRDRFRCALVLPFFVRGKVAGTVTLASKTDGQYGTETDAKKMEPVTTKLSQLFEDPNLKLSVYSPPPTESPGAGGHNPDGVEQQEMRRQERQAALTELSSFLATEVREPMRFIRAQLEDATGEGSLDFDSQTRIETAMRDLVRVETFLGEILDFAKPLDLDRRPCRVPDLIEQALSLIQTDLKASRIEVIREISPRIAQVKWDEAKMQQAFLSIFKNALEAMSPGGHLRVGVAMKRGRHAEVVITIHNDGAPIPPELVDKVFEPYFTTKRSGTGLGLATVKKIVEEHQGQISIQSGEEEGTTVAIQLPTLRPRPLYRSRGNLRKSRRNH